MYNLKAVSPSPESIITFPSSNQGAPRMEAEIVRGVGEGVFGRVQGQQREEITFIPHSGCCEWGRKGARCERSWHGNDNFTIGAWPLADRSQKYDRGSRDEMGA